MTNADKILCPGCGDEMELVPEADYGLLYGFQYHCNRCGWDSPLMQTEKEAREMAGRRVDPVRRGSWIYVSGVIINPHFRCSICGRPRYEHYAVNSFDYCPHCGAKMDGGSE